LVNLSNEMILSEIDGKHTFIFKKNLVH